MNGNLEIINETKTGIISQIEDMDGKIQNCQENGDWKVESILLHSRKRLKSVFEKYPY